MGEVIEENKRLKMVLHHIKKDCKSLQLRLFDIVKEDHQDLKKPSTDNNNISSVVDHHGETEEAELVSLSLGRSPKEPKNINTVEDSKTNFSTTRDQNKVHDHHDDQDLIKANLTLGLGSNQMQLTSELANEPIPENSSDQSEVIKELAEAKTPNKRNNNGDDEVSEQPHAKRARVSVRARCDTPTVSN